MDIIHVKTNNNKNILLALYNVCNKTITKTIQKSIQY